MEGRSKSQRRSLTRSKQRSHSRSHSRSQRGGSWGQYPDSAWGFQMNNLGNGWTQFMNSLSLQPGESQSAAQSNNIVAVKNMSGGKNRRRMQQRANSQSRGKKGGYWGAVMEQAAVPLALLGLQQAYGKRHTRKQGSRNKPSRRRR